MLFRSGESLRRRIGEAIHAEHFEREYAMMGVTLGYRYEGSPIVVPDGTPEPPDDAIEYRPSARPGHRAPHAWLADGRSTLDLFGAGFTLLSFDHADAGVAALAKAAQLRNVPFVHHVIDDARVRELYASPLVLVRPDGHVAWRGERVPDDALALIDTVRGA